MNCLKCLAPLIPEVSHYGLHADCFIAWFKTAGPSEFVSLTRQSSQSPDNANKISPQNTSFFHGKFKKYSAELDSASYILKMREIDAPELPEVEYLCNQIGASLSLPVADFFIIDFEGDKVFVTKNFIKRAAPSDLQHIYHFRPDDKHNCETLIQVIIEKTKRPYDVGVLIDTILFDALIGNHDRHGRNLALVITSGNIALSPIYDNVSYLGLEKGGMLKADFNPLGKIATQETIEPSMVHYIRELKRLGYKDRVQEFHARVKMGSILNLIQKSLCSDLMRAAMLKLITKRYKELEDELNA